MVASADFAFADPDTGFSLRETRLGLIPATVAPFVMQRTGFNRAKQLMLGGELIGTERALSAGLIDGVFRVKDSEAEIQKLVSEILKNAPEATAQTKSLLSDIRKDISADELRDLSARLIARKRLSAEATEGIAAFFEKRKPNWVAGY